MRKRGTDTKTKMLKRDTTFGGLPQSIAGAIDLASIMVGVIVLGIIGGVVAATVFSVIPWSQDNAAKAELGAVRDAQTIARVQEGAYLTIPQLVERGYLPAGATASGGSAVATASFGAATAVEPIVIDGLTGTVDSDGACYLAASASDTGNVFFTTSESVGVFLYEAGVSEHACGDIGALAELLIPQPPVIIAGALAGVMAEEAYTATIGYTGSADTVLSSSNLPTGLTLNPTTGAVTGAIATAGLVTFDVTATNTVGAVTETYTILVAPRTVMVSTWNTTLSGCTTITLPIKGAVTGTVDWGDGTTAPLTTNPTHTYTGATGTKTVKIAGTFAGWTAATVFDPSPEWTPTCVTEVKEWVGTETTTLANGFAWAQNLTAIAETPAGVTDMSSLFLYSTKFNGSMSGLDTSKVTNMYRMFFQSSAFNQPLTGFDTSQVTNMSEMFRNSIAFNQPLDTFNTSQVTNMSFMFSGSNIFNQPLTSFNTSKVTTMFGMFSYAVAFNGSVESFDTSNVSNMRSMFSSASAFNKPLTSFNTGGVTDMSGMFLAAKSFNQPLTTFDTSKVTTMAQMFSNAATFNSLLNFNTTNVTDMGAMFSDAVAFNRSLTSFNTAKVTNMFMMLSNTTVFNQNLTGWNVNAVTDKLWFRLGSALTDANTPVPFR
jgi:surface protein